MTGGVIATGIFGVGLAYIANELIHGSIFTGRRSDASIVNAVLFLVVFGLPAAKHLLATSFGLVDPPKPLSEQLFVDFNDESVRMRRPESTDERRNPEPSVGRKSLVFAFVTKVWIIPTYSSSS